MFEKEGTAVAVTPHIACRSREGLGFVLAELTMRSCGLSRDWDLRRKRRRRRGSPGEQASEVPAGSAGRNGDPTEGGCWEVGQGSPGCPLWMLLGGRALPCGVRLCGWFELWVKEGPCPGTTGGARDQQAGFRPASLRPVLGSKEMGRVGSQMSRQQCHLEISVEFVAVDGWEAGDQLRFPGCRGPGAASCAPQQRTTHLVAENRAYV